MRSIARFELFTELYVDFGLTGSSLCFSLLGPTLHPVSRLGTKVTLHTKLYYRLKRSFRLEYL